MDSKRFTRRLVALGAAMFLCALVFVVTLFDAQIVNGDDYLDKSIRTNAKTETVKASRGILTARNGKVLVSHRASTMRIADTVYSVEHGCTPADLNYEGYPKSWCTSINDVVCHGIPCDTDVLHEGDIINVDCSTILDGYFSDSSRMFCIGEVSAARQHLVDVTRASVEAGLAAVKPWLPLSVMAEAVQKTVEYAGFSVVR